MRLLLIVLCLTSCATKLQMPKPTPIKSVKELRIINLENCQKAYTKAAAYLYLSGVQVNQSECARKSLTCYRATPLLLQLLNMVPTRIGETLIDSSYVNVTGDVEYDAKLILHELLHLYYQAPHTLSGVMHPMASVGCQWATGLDDATKELIK